MINDKTRTKTSKDGDRTYTDSTYRTWLRNVGEGGDRTSLVRTVSTCTSADDKYIAADITLADCSGTINYDLYIDSAKAYARQLRFLDKLIAELLETKRSLVREAEALGLTGDTK